MTRIDTSSMVSHWLDTTNRTGATVLASMNGLPPETQLLMMQKLAEMRAGTHLLASKAFSMDAFLHEMDQELLRRTREHYHPNPLPKEIEEIFRRKGDPDSGEN